MAEEDYTTPVGLDTGTNNTVVSGIEKGSKTHTFVKTVNGEILHGSYVYYPEKSTDDIIYGKEALQMLPSKNVIKVFKRALGVTSQQIQEKKMSHIFNAEIANEGKQRQVMFKFTIDDKEVQKSAREVMVDYLKHIKELVDAQFGENLKWVCSRPQYWNTKQTGIFEECLKDAGISPVLKVISEPVAAAYVYSGKMISTEDKRILVDDFGAGTLDIVLLQNNGNGNFKDVVTGGDAFLGGSNIDEIFLKLVQKELEKEDGFNKEAFDQQTPMLKEEMKKLKHNLSTLPKVSTTIFGCTKKNSYVFKMDQEKKNKALQLFYERKEAVIKNTFELASEGCGKKYTADQLMKSTDVVALVGGANRDPYYGKEMHPKLFPRAKIIGKAKQAGTENPDEVVSIGNTMWAAAHMSVETIKGLPPKPVHRAVLSQSLGVETVSGYGTPNEKCYFSKIVWAGTPIPTRVKNATPYSTVKDDQDKVVVEVYQGEGDLVSEDGVLSLEKYEVDLKKPNKKGEPQIEVEMEITAKNTLIVRAGEIGEEKAEMTIENVS